MKIQIRKSGGAECYACGSTDLIATVENEKLEADILPLVEGFVRESEETLVNEFEEEKVSLSDMWAQETKDLKEKLASEHLAYEQRIEELLGQRAPFYRLFKRQWQKRLRAELERVTAELREKTARA